MNGALSAQDKKKEISITLIPHSMGGLVARSACEVHNARGNVLAVIHGVQPSTGAPAAYWRMKGGWERPKASGPNNDAWDWLRSPLKSISTKLEGTAAPWVLGTDGEEVTSILGNIPGGLELLPTPDYVDNEGKTAWLSYEGRYGTIKLPKRDVYDEIYLEKEKAYRLVESWWLDPGKKESNLEDAIDAWRIYAQNIENVRDFHTKKLQTKRHPESYQFYVTCLDSADKIVLKNLNYSAEPSWPASRGKYQVYVNDRDKPVQEERDAIGQIRMEYPSGDGDGTVPKSSGAALDIPESKRYEVVKTDINAAFEMAHQDIFKFKQARTFVFYSLWDVLYGLIKNETGKQYPIKEKAASQ